MFGTITTCQNRWFMLSIKLTTISFLKVKYIPYDLMDSYLEGTMCPEDELESLQSLGHQV